MVMILALVLILRDKARGMGDNFGKGCDNQNAPKNGDSIIVAGCVWFCDAHIQAGKITII